MKTNTPLLFLMAAFSLFACEKGEEVEAEKLQVHQPSVDWISKMKIHNDQVQLVWSATATITTAFELERKVGGADFEVIFRLDGADVSPYVSSYSFTDHNLEKYRVIQYRIRSFSEDDTSEYTNIPSLVIGEITKQGNYSNARYESQLCRTQDGEVVMVGGEKYPSTIYTEKFIPATGEWLTGPALAQGRRGHRALLLQSGKILVTGGTARDKHFESTELYDPVTGTFSPGASMKHPHTSHTMTALEDGRVLVVGGYRSNAVFSDKCELYDPNEDIWKEIAPLNTARAGHRTFQLTNGDILVIGGVTRDVEGHPTASCELYSFSTGTWKEVSPLQSKRKDFTAFKVAEDKILVAAGSYWGTDTQIELYDAGNLRSLKQPNSLLSYHATEAVDLGSGLVLLYGRVSYGLKQDHPLSLQVYDKASGQWLLTNFLPFENKEIYDVGVNGVLLEQSKALFTSVENESLTFQLRLER
ncbi:Kelch repeat-containing protein [Pontibacter chinhatensis]|uniref:Kelch motif-containing protein n=1 Tax=Pontibacter chinhatensis TaxID=1436961 RepID=A0A1I2R159_9BACT|nr:kelch repeat-containing protein [Pontibacter chinhatensis]SFG32287.1 Kelch motif-containing protein [Pontibacter chinhatensis]